MQASNIPAKFAEPFAKNATASYIRTIPTVSGDPTVASLDLGFPPATATPVGAGGVPPNIADMNGILNPLSAWAQWFSAGGPIVYDATFQTAIGGYPNGAVVGSAVTAGLSWRSTADNNLTNPDASGAGWVNNRSFVSAQVITASGTYTPGATTTLIHYRMVGGGAGGGGAGQTSAGSGGGGAGSYCEGWATVTPGAGITATIGAAGTAGAGSNVGAATSGGNGGTTSLGAIASAPGGTGGPASNTVNQLATGGLGGTTPTGGSINTPGAPGGPGFQATNWYGGIGGTPQIFGAGGNVSGSSLAGLPGLGFGAGGAGGGNTAAGGVGTHGLIEIEEYAS